MSYLHQRIRVSIIGQRVVGTVKSTSVGLVGGRVSLVIETEGGDGRLMGVAAKPEQIEVLAKGDNDGT